MTISPEDQKRWREAAESASPGPWEARMLGGGKGGPNSYSVRDAGSPGDSDHAIARVWPRQNASTPKAALSGGWNAHFIVLAREALLPLLDRVRDLEREVLHLTDQINTCTAERERVRADTAEARIKALEAENERLSKIIGDRLERDFEKGALQSKPESRTEKP